MSKEKVSTQEIIDLVATRLSVSKRAAEDFLKALFSTIEESLLEGESVKIKKLGTFKLQWNAPRKSVNVQTGEEFIISGYYKISFSPESSLKDIVNKPFEHLEPIELDADNEPIVAEPKSEESVEDDIYDPLRVFTEQASEIKDLLSEINALSALNTKAEETEKDDRSLLEDNFDAEIENFVEDIESEVDDADIQDENEDDELEDDVDKTIIEEQVEKEIEIYAKSISEDIIVENEFVVVENVDGPTIDSGDLIDSAKEQIPEVRVNLASVVEHILPLETVDVHVQAAKLANESVHINKELVQQEPVEAKASFENESTLDVFENEIMSDHQVFEAAVDARDEVIIAGEDSEENTFIAEVDPFTVNVKKKGKKGKGCLVFILVFFLLIAGFVVNYYLSSATRCWIKYDLLSDQNKIKLDDATAKMALWFDSFKTTEVNKTKVIDHVDVVALPIEKDTILNNDTIPQPEIIDSLQVLFDSPRVFVEYIGSEKIREGSSLTRVSERFYGHKDFWVYIYEANKNLIKNPDQVPYGIVVKIPKVDKRLIDAKNPRCIKKAKELHDLYVGKNKK